MQAQQMWDDVAILTASDFGRTLSDNGQGSDHGWCATRVVPCPIMTVPGVLVHMT